MDATIRRSVVIELQNDEAMLLLGHLEDDLELPEPENQDAYGAARMELVEAFTRILRNALREAGSV